MTDYDIVILGAGVVGLTFAAAVAKLPLKIAILEQKSSISPKADTAIPNRVSAINLSSEFALRRLGVWPSIIDQSPSPFTKVIAWDAVGGGEIEFLASELGLPYLGHVIENDAITQSLWQHCQGCDNIDSFFGIIPEAFYPHATGAELVTATISLNAKLWVAADGAHSWLRQHAGIEQIIKPYQQTAIVATVATASPHKATARQCFLPSGPLAFLPLPGLPDYPHLCSIVWSTSEHHAQDLMSMEASDFNHQLAIAFDARLGAVEVLGPRVALPLVMRHAKQYHANQVVLIGDAAHTIHPLAGQGMNLGIMDACQLAENLAKAYSQKRPLYSEKLLRDYARKRYAANQTMADIMQSFKYLFSKNTGIIPSLRSIGLQFTQKTKPLKHLLLRQALGLWGEQPQLAQFHPQLFFHDDLLKL